MELQNIYKIEEDSCENAKNNKTQKDTFIFGSWKHRRSKKSSRTVLETVITTDENENNKFLNQQNNISRKSNTSTLSRSKSHCKYNPPSQMEYNFNRRAISVYDHLYEEDFWCPRCNQKMEEPRILPCLHAVCAKCVSEFMSKNYYGSTPPFGSNGGDSYDILRKVEGCSICGFPLPKYNSRTPPPHYPLQHRLVMYVIRRRLSQRAICCETCTDEVQAISHCSTCLCNFCQDCAKNHETYFENSSPKHQILPLWEARKLRRVAVCLSHPSHPLKFHCIACQQVTCKECMWQGSHRGHASEDAVIAGKRTVIHLYTALRLAKTLLNSLLTDYNEKVLPDDTEDEKFSFNSSLQAIYHSRSQSTLSYHTKEAKARIREFSRLKRARYLIDAIFIGEDLLANGSDIEILSLKHIISKRLKFLGVSIESADCTNSLRKKKLVSNHVGVYHCCTFCSSGGKKEAICACDGTMPGGYKGCGHGHSGHPGSDHWSCCGSTNQNSACLHPRKSKYRILL